MLESNLGMVIREGISEKVIFKLGSNARREPGSESWASHGEGTPPGKGLDRNKVGIWGGGMKRSPVCLEHSG